MKVRKGFVSNSSSSSFVIGYDKEFPSKEEVINYFKENVDNLDSFVVYRLDKEYSLAYYRITKEQIKEIVSNYSKDDFSFQGGVSGFVPIVSGDDSFDFVVTKDFVGKTILGYYTEMNEDVEKAYYVSEVELRELM